MILSDIDKAKTILEENGNIVKVTDVVGIAVSDEPGSMSKVISILSKAGINIEYMYAFVNLYNYKAMNNTDYLSRHITPPRDWSLRQTSSWLNYFNGRDHASKIAGLIIRDSLKKK